MLLFLPIPRIEFRLVLSCDVNEVIVLTVSQKEGHPVSLAGWNLNGSQAKGYSMPLNL